MSVRGSHDQPPAVTVCARGSRSNNNADRGCATNVGRAWKNYGARFPGFFGVSGSLHDRELRVAWLAQVSFGRLPLDSRPVSNGQPHLPPVRRVRMNFHCEKWIGGGLQVSAGQPIQPDTGDAAHCTDYAGRYADKRPNGLPVHFVLSPLDQTMAGNYSQAGKAA